LRKVPIGFRDQVFISQNPTGKPQLTVLPYALECPTWIEVGAMQQWMSISPCSAQFAIGDSSSQQSIEWTLAGCGKFS